MPGRLVITARKRLYQAEAGSTVAEEHAGHGQQPAAERDFLARRLCQPPRWADAASYTIADLTRLRREAIIGFIVAGFVATGVPAGFRNAVFPRHLRLPG